MWLQIMEMPVDFMFCNDFRKIHHFSLMESNKNGDKKIPPFRQFLLDLPLHQMAGTLVKIIVSQRLELMGEVLRTCLTTE